MRPVTLSGLLPAGLALLLVAVPLAGSAKDEVYKWVDKNGVVHYSGEPPTDKAKPAELPPIQTYKPGATKSPISVLDSSSTPSRVGGAAVAVSEVRITSPLPEEVFRDNTGSIPVSVAVVPGAPAGASYAFYLDGRLQNARALAAPAFTFTNVERGAHTVSVAVLDGAGRELKRSASITFHNQPPRVRP